MSFHESARFPRSRRESSGPLRCASRYCAGPFWTSCVWTYSNTPSTPDIQQSPSRYAPGAPRRGPSRLFPAASFPTAPRHLSRLALIAAVLVSHMAVVRADGPPHDSTNGIDCVDCHGLHGFGSDFVLRDYEQESLCLGCHNPLGMAPGMTEVAMHVVNADSTIIDCGSCHNPHGADETTDEHSGVSADNLSLIRDDPTEYWDSALDPAVFHTSPDDFVFSDEPWNGICQTCHTTTDHHTNDATGDHTHYTGLACTSCHPHDMGFLPAGGCFDCHNQEQGSRRQIVENEGDGGGDFVSTSHHIGGEIQEVDCVACHYMSDHAYGTVKLKDPDQGASIVYDYDDSDPSLIEDFCLNCHDSEGAEALDNPLQPFSDGQSPPDISGNSLWASSAHASFGYDANGGFPITCMGDGSTSGCHGNAHGSDAVKLLNAASGTTIDTFCFGCHTEGGIQNDALSNNRTGDYVSADDIEQAFGKSSSHPMESDFTMNGDSFTLQCSTCHNPHVVTGQYWDAEADLTPISRPDFSDPSGNPRAMGTSTWGESSGEKMDDFAADASGSGGWYYSVARGWTISIDQNAVYQPPKDGSDYNFEFAGDLLPDYASFCLDCHGSTMGSYPAVNWGQGIDCTGNSVDPPDQRIECGAQHGLGSADKPYYWGDVGMYGSSGNPDPIFNEPDVTRGRGAGHFMRWPYDSAYRNAGINFVMACTDCHEAHGSDRGGMIRERLNVTGNGDCGTGGDSEANGENCSDGSNWNSFCNVCHYYYGGQHAGMSCGNASCHEANSIHRIIHNTESSGTYLWTPTTYPSYTPEIDYVQGTLEDNQLYVGFTEGVWTNSDASGSLEPGDFLLTDVGDDNPREILGVTHTAGDSEAILTLSAPLITADAGTDLLATTGISAWNSVGDSAGPWPNEITLCPPDFYVEFDEAAGSSSVTESYGVMSGTVNNPSFTMQGDGYFHGDKTEEAYVDFDSDTTCLAEANYITIDAVFFTDDVDTDYDGPGDLWPDIDSTFHRIFERKRSIKATILHANYRGDNIDDRANKASIEVKYYVDTDSRHTCPHDYWPDDTYEGDDSRWHQISTDIDTYPIQNYHWYQMRVVFSSDKLTAPVDIFLEDLGTDGAGADQAWSGFRNASQSIQDSSTCQWGALPGDYIVLEDQATYIGTNPSHNADFMFAGLIDWIQWRSEADYDGLDDPAF